ncbi:hypothetical protein YH65_06780 [Sulfurovum lithotrophicum]|uniref:Uncharacterized protein n=1 Tax=Sulfurovum lithotrophicum TaxID=206403 RepID=A0A7U4M1K0_9BACT|nr:hypothetical protein [Sulfurovum lithotrophicum]AKF25130.1 hypothetical protein YH65_06780 [Sulfurovum lithotrophicum]
MYSVSEVCNKVMFEATPAWQVPQGHFFQGACCRSKLSVNAVQGTAFLGVISKVGANVVS